MAAIITDNFNSYTNGNLNGQGSWSQADNTAQVEAGDASNPEGASFGKQISIAGAAGGSNYALKTGSSLTDGTQTFYIKRTFNTASTGYGCDLLDTSNAGVITIRFISISSNIRFQYQDSTATWTDIKTGLSASTWYSLEIEWRSSDNTARYRVTAAGSTPGAWDTAFVSRLSTNTPTKIGFFRGSGTAGDTGYFDYFDANVVPPASAVAEGNAVFFGTNF